MARKAHGIAQVASGNDLELAAAQETLAIRNGNPVVSLKQLLQRQA